MRSSRTTTRCRKAHFHGHRKELGGPRQGEALGKQPFHCAVALSLELVANLVVMEATALQLFFPFLDRSLQLGQALGFVEELSLVALPLESLDFTAQPVHRGACDQFGNFGQALSVAVALALPGGGAVVFELGGQALAERGACGRASTA